MMVRRRQQRDMSPTREIPFHPRAATALGVPARAVTSEVGAQRTQLVSMVLHQDHKDSSRARYLCCPKSVIRCSDGLTQRETSTRTGLSASLTALRVSRMSASSAHPPPWAPVCEVADLDDEKVLRDVTALHVDTRRGEHLEEDRQVSADVAHDHCPPEVLAGHGPPALTGLAPDDTSTKSRFRRDSAPRPSRPSRRLLLPHVPRPACDTLPFLPTGSNGSHLREQCPSGGRYAHSRR